MNDSDIFVNQGDVKENMDDSLRNLGVNPEEIKNNGVTLTTKKSCKMCWGRGVIILHTPDGEITDKYCRCVRLRRKNV